MYVILGVGSVGSNVAQLLKDRGRDVFIVDGEPGKIDFLRQRGFNAVVEDIATVDLRSHNIERPDAAILLGPDFQINVDIVTRLKNEMPGTYTIVRSLDPITSDSLKKARADCTIEANDIMAKTVVREIEMLEMMHASEKLIDIISEASQKGVGIFMHDNPDPDVIASSMALQKICSLEKVPTRIFYGGTISRQENKTMVNLLKVPVEQVRDRDEAEDLCRQFDKIAMIETVPGSKNNTLPDDVQPDIIIDHHPIDDRDIEADFTYIQNVGAASTLMVKMLQQLNISPGSTLATALLYGIRSDTHNFMGNVTSDDLIAAAYLQALVDKDLLLRIESPPMSIETMDVIGRAIADREDRGAYLVSCVGFTSDRDALPQAADFLMKLEGTSTVLVFGIIDEVIHISARSSDARVNVGSILSSLFGQGGGGHATAAGAQVPLGIFDSTDDRDMLLKLVRSSIARRFFEAVGAF